MRPWKECWSQGKVFFKCSVAMFLLGVVFAACLYSDLQCYRNHGFVEYGRKGDNEVYQARGRAAHLELLKIGGVAGIGFLASALTLWRFLHPAGSGLVLTCPKGHAVEVNTTDDAVVCAQCGAVLVPPAREETA